MALTKPSFNNINTATTQAYFNDTQITLNYGNVTANNQDIGFVFNRGTSSNVALIWSEVTKGFVLAYTPSSGLTSGNVTVSANANLRVGNLEVSGVTTYSGGITGTDLTLSGNLTVNGTTVTINSTTVTTNDKNIVVANNQSTSSGIDGSGIDAGGGTPIATWRYNHATTSWQSNVGILPAANNTLTLGGASNYWNNIYSTTHTGTTGTFTGTVTAATVNAATIGNTGSSHIGASVSAATIGNAGAAFTGASISAATIGNAGATLTGTTVNAATIGNSGAVLYGTLNSSSAAQTNITSVGTLTGLTLSGTLNGTTLQASTIGNVGAAHIGATVQAATIGNAGATLTGTTVNAATIGNASAVLYGTLNSSSAAQTNITSVGTLTGLTLSGTLNGTTLQAATIGNTGATLTGSTVNAATIGNVGASHVGASISAATIGNTGATLTGSTVNAATIGNAGATLIGATVNAATIGNTGATLIGTTANISGNATISGNVVNGNVFATGYFYANGYAFTGGSGGSPGGSTSQIQYNNGGVFAGAAGVTTDGSNLILTSQGDLRFADADSTHWVAFQAPATITANVTWTLPSADGSANQALVTNGSGTLSWAAAGAAITNDTSTTLLYPSMANVTTGYLTDARVSSTKFSFNASTGTISTVALNAATIGNSGATLTGTLNTAAQTNITSVGTLTGLTLSGTLTGTTINAATIGNAGASLVGNLSNAITVNNGGAGAASGSTYNNSGTLIISHNTIGAAPQAGNSSIVTVGNITSGTWSATLGAISGAALTNLTANNLSGTIPSAVLGNSTHYIGTTAIALNRASGNQTLTGVSIDGSAGSATTATNQSGGTVAATTGTFSTSATRNSRNIPTYVASATAPTSPLQGDIWYDTTSDIVYKYINDGTNSVWVDQSRASVFSTLSATGNVTIAGTITVNSGNNITAIVNGGTSGTGNIGATGAGFNTIFAKATTAQYADLAENYLADSAYEPGTVVCFGGTAEITVSDVSHDTRVAGVISTNPGFLMNEGQVTGLPVAFTGRVPCKVQGPVAKGDVLVNIGDGLAGKMNPAQYQPGCILGKSLENISENMIKTIEVVVGRF